MHAMNDIRDIRRLIASAAADLDTISDTPRLEAELLVARAIDRPRSYLFAHPENQLDDAARARLDSELRRRLDGEPLAYISGVKEFWSLELKVTPATLVPRPETERTVEIALAAIPRGRRTAVLDLGTGSGAIACAIAWERRLAEVTGVDISAAALAVAAHNARQLNLDNLRFVEGSWTEPVRHRKYALVISNPPYVAADDTALQALHREPVTALVPPGDELSAIRAVADQAPGVLAPGGVLVLEHGSKQAARVATLLHEAGWHALAQFTDHTGLPRVTRARREAATDREDPSC